MIEIGGIVLAKLRFPDPAGQLQDRQDKAALAAELGDNYARYHKFLRDEIAKLPGLRPKRHDYPDIASFLQANEWSEDIVKAEVILRKCRAFRRSGARLAAQDDSGRPVVDANDNLVGLT
jgi:hypothetical protein